MQVEGPLYPYVTGDARTAGQRRLERRLPAIDPASKTPSLQTRDPQSTRVARDQDYAASVVAEIPTSVAETISCGIVPDAA
jgi:hypothetical protein